MISANFRKTHEKLFYVSVLGHAEYDDSGKDIVCAAVSSAVQLSANLITEIYKIPAIVSDRGNLIIIDGKNIQNDNFDKLMKGLLLHLNLLEEQFSEYISVGVTEV